MANDDHGRDGHDDTPIDGDTYSMAATSLKVRWRIRAQKFA
jgi:hypothetical protein